MNKTKSNKENLSYKSVIFWSIILVLTISFIATMIVRFSERTSRPVQNFDDVQVFQNAMFEKTETEYLVYIYGTGTNENDSVLELEEHILNYLTFIKRNSKDSKAISLYAFNIDAQANQRVFVRGGDSTLSSASNFSTMTLNEGDVPSLVVIRGGRVNRVIRGENQIKDHLITIIESIPNAK
jgi:hypothetical protein